MGVNQSVEIQPRSNLYDILQIERNSEENEIRKAYKKLALKLHPDRNIGAEQEAATKFAKVLAAYEVLIDPQERAWYDQHDETAEYSEYTTKITKSPELRQYMEASFVKTMNPESDSFYRLVTELFERIRNEELEAGFELGIAKEGIPSMEAPLFGHINAEWPQVKAFYDTWKSFSTLKSFKWEDVYPIHHAEDRRSRRMMETRNKRVRDSAKKEFNDTVRSLVTLVYTFDVRVKNQQKIQDRKHIKAQEKKQAKKPAKQESKPEFKEQEWAKVQKEGNFECIVCDIMFDSSAELGIHEETIEHMKLLKKLQQQMIEEDIMLNPRSEVNLDNTDAAVEELASQTETLSVDDIMSEMDSHRKQKKVLEPKEKQKKAKKKKQSRIDAQEASLKCFTCQTVFGHRNDLLAHCKVSKHPPPVFR